MSSVPNNLSGSARLSPDDRYELASRSLMHERRSRPVHLVALGIIILVVSLVTLAIAWQHDRSAGRTLRSNQVASINADRMITQITELNNTQDQSTGDDEFAPIPDILTRLERIALQVGLENDFPLPKTTTPRTEGSTRLLTYPYTVRDNSLERILDWIQTSQEQIPGLQIREITINLNTASWIVKVTLTRYERIE